MDNKTEFALLLEKANIKMTEITRRYEIPYRTLQHWKAGTTQCPAYIIKMLSILLNIE